MARHPHNTDPHALTRVDVLNARRAGLETMKLIRTIIVILASLVLFAGGFAPAQGQDSARFHFVHADPGSPDLDVFVNGELAATDVTYGAATAYMRVPAGEVALTAYLATTSVQLISETLALDAEATAAILASRAGGRIYAAADDLSQLAVGRARVTLFNALEAAATVALLDANDAALSRADLSPGAAQGPGEFDAGVYNVSVRASGAVADSLRIEAALHAGVSHLLIIHGRRDNPQLVSVSAATESGGDSGSVRFVHTVGGAAPLDLHLNDQLILPALAFGEPSPHIALPSGSHHIALFLGPAEILSQQLDIRAGQASTVAIMGSSAGLTLRVFRDSFDSVDESTAVVSLINAIPGSVISHLQLEGGAIAAFNVPFGEAGDAARIAPGTQSMTVHLDIGDDRGAMETPARHFAGGSYYNIIALAGGAFSAPRLLVAETSLQRHVRATMPKVAEEAPAEVAPPEPEIEEQIEERLEAQAVADVQEQKSALQTEAAHDEAAAEPEPATAERSAEISDTESAAELAATPTQDDGPTQTVVTPEATTETETRNLIVAGSEITSLTPYAVVYVDPDSALHIRQYPSSEAMSLGLLPAESELMVLGRRAPADLDGFGLSLLPVDLSDFTTDPAAALRPYQDLTPADTWLFTVYMTPDGGALYGWVNAFYLEVFTHRGQPQRLASLAPVRQNQLGGATNTDIRPPSLADHISARVVGLNPGAYLNLRAGNSASTEVLTQVAADAVLGFIGVDCEEAWAFVSYESPQGTRVTGRASMEYIQLLLNGRPALAASLRALDPSAAPILGDVVTGAIQPADPSDADAAGRPMTGIVGEVDVNFDSALHLRRYPDATSESLALIPRGVRLQLDGVTASSGWYKVAYEGDSGWVAGDYLILSMDGRQYARAFLDGHLPRFTDLGT